MSNGSFFVYNMFHEAMFQHKSYRCRTYQYATRTRLLAQILARTFTSLCGLHNYVRLVGLALSTKNRFVVSSRRRVDFLISLIRPMPKPMQNFALLLSPNFPNLRYCSFLETIILLLVCKSKQKLHEAY